MFTRREDFVMQMDVELEQAFEERLATFAKRAGASVERVLALGMRSIVGNVERRAAEALLQYGQTPMSFAADLDRAHVRIGVAFEGDTAGATAAFDAWRAGIMRLKKSERIRSGWLKGSDGTYRTVST